MAQYTLQYGTEIVDGASYKVHAYHLTGNFSALASDINDRLSMITGSAQTVAGPVTFTSAPTFSSAVTFGNGLTSNGISTFSSTINMTGHVNLARAGDQGTPAEGDFWYNSTTHLPKFYNGTTTKTLASLTDIDAMLPTQTGNSGKVLTTNGTTSSWVSPAFSVYNLSSNITITAAGAWSVTHGLGAAPKGIQLFLKCLTAELNYAVGDMAFVSSDNAHATNDLGAGATILSGNTTTINGRFGASASTFFIPDKTTGVNSGITNSKWALVVASWT